MQLLFSFKHTFLLVVEVKKENKFSTFFFLSELAPSVTLQEQRQEQQQQGCDLLELPIEYLRSRGVVGSPENFETLSTFYFPYTYPASDPLPSSPFPHPYLFSSSIPFLQHTTTMRFPSPPFRLPSSHMSLLSFLTLASFPTSTTSYAPSNLSVALSPSHGPSV